MKTIISTILFVSLCSTTFADVTLDGTDSYGQTSFNTGLNWSDGLAPHAGTNYLISSGQTLRTPEGSDDHVFQGDALTIDNGFINLKGTGKVTIDDFRIYGCRIANGIGTCYVYGTNTIYGTAGAPSRYSGSQNRFTHIYAALQGSGEFQVERTGGENIGDFACRLYAANTNFTGGITVVGSGIKIGIDSTNTLGNVLTLKNSGTLYSLNAATLAYSIHDITVDNGGIIEAAYADITVESTIKGSGDITVKGSYVTTLNSALTLDGNVVIDGGKLTVGSNFAQISGKSIVLKSGQLYNTSTVNSDITIDGGTLNAGNIGSTGSLTVSNVLFKSGSFEFDFSSGTNADFVNIIGDLTRSGSEDFVIRLTQPVANESDNFALITAANMSDYTTNDFEVICSYHNLPEGELEIIGDTLYFNQARPVVYLTASGHDNGNALTTESSWSNSELPSSANDYIVAYNRRLRTHPGSSTATVTFNGNSLTLADGADMRIKNQRFIVEDLRLYDQRITQGTPPNVQYLDGNISVMGPYDFENDGSLSRVLVIDSEMSGSEDIRFKMSVEKSPPVIYSGPNGKFEMTAANTNFTGGITILGPNITYLTITNEINLGGNPPAFRADQLELGYTGILAVTESVTLDDPNRGITLADAGSMEIPDGETLAVACPITGDGVLFKNGDGTLALSGDNDYSGGTILEAGTLELHSEDALGTGTLSLNTSTSCKVLVDETNMPLGARVADLLGVTIEVEPIFSAGITLGVEIPLFLLTADTPTVSAEDITLTGVPIGYAAEVESRIVDDNGTDRTLLYTKYIIPGTIILVK